MSESDGSETGGSPIGQRVTVQIDHWFGSSGQGRWLGYRFRWLIGLIGGDRVGYPNPNRRGSNTGHKHDRTQHFS
jgi:hypothetical protein